MALYKHCDQSQKLEPPPPDAEPPSVANLYTSLAPGCETGVSYTPRKCAPCPNLPPLPSPGLRSPFGEKFSSRCGPLTAQSTTGQRPNGSRTAYHRNVTPSPAASTAGPVLTRHTSNSLLK